MAQYAAAFGKQVLCDNSAGDIHCWDPSCISTGVHRLTTTISMFDDRLDIKAIQTDISSKYVPPHVNIVFSISYAGISTNLSDSVPKLGDPFVYWFERSFTVAPEVIPDLGNVVLGSPTRLEGLSVMSSAGI